MSTEMPMLRIVFVAQVGKFSDVMIAPANHKPPVVTKPLAVIARETVRAVLERYGVGNWA